MPILMAGGGKLVGRYKITEQLVGDDGPKLMAILEYPNAHAVNDLIDGEAFN